MHLRLGVGLLVLLLAGTANLVAQGKVCSLLTGRQKRFWRGEMRVSEAPGREVRRRPFDDCVLGPSEGDVSWGDEDDQDAGSDGQGQHVNGQCGWAVAVIALVAPAG